MARKTSAAFFGSMQARVTVVIVLCLLLHSAFLMVRLTECQSELAAALSGEHAGVDSSVCHKHHRHHGKRRSLHQQHEQMKVNARDGEGPRLGRLAELVGDTIDVVGLSNGGDDSIERAPRRDSHRSVESDGGEQKHSEQHEEIVGSTKGSEDADTNADSGADVSDAEASPRASSDDVGNGVASDDRADDLFELAAKDAAEYDARHRKGASGTATRHGSALSVVGGGGADTLLEFGSALNTSFSTDCLSHTSLFVEEESEYVDRLGVRWQPRPLMSHLTLCVIVWRELASLAQAWRTWRQNGLFTVVDEILVWINERDEEKTDFVQRLLSELTHDTSNSESETSVSHTRIMGTTLNWNSTLPLVWLNGNATGDHVMVLDGDFALVADKSQLRRRLAIARRLLFRRVVDTVQLRSRTHPGEPLMAAMKYRDHEDALMAEAPHLLCQKGWLELCGNEGYSCQMCLMPLCYSISLLIQHHKTYNSLEKVRFWISSLPEKRFPQLERCPLAGPGADGGEEWHCPWVQHCGWTNGPSLFYRTWFLHELAPMLAQVGHSVPFPDSYLNENPTAYLVRAYRTALAGHFGVGDGLFEHRHRHGAFDSASAQDEHVRDAFNQTIDVVENAVKSSVEQMQAERIHMRQKEKENVENIEMPITQVDLWKTYIEPAEARMIAEASAAEREGGGVRVVDRVTVVTAMFDIGRRDVSMKGQLDSFVGTLRRLQTPVVAFVCNRTYTHLVNEKVGPIADRRLLIRLSVSGQSHYDQTLNGNNATLLERLEWLANVNSLHNLTSLLLGDDVLKKIDTLRKEKSYAKYASWMPLSPQVTLRHFIPLRLSKVPLLTAVARQNPFRTSKFLWLDGGHQCLRERIEDIGGTRKLRRVMDDAVVDLYDEVERQREVDGLPWEAFMFLLGLPQSYREPIRVERTGLMGSNARTLSALNVAYLSLLNASLRVDRLALEDAVLSMVAYRWPDLLWGERDCDAFFPR